MTDPDFQAFTLIDMMKIIEGENIVINSVVKIFSAPEEIRQKMVQ